MNRLLVQKTDSCTMGFVTNLNPLVHVVTHYANDGITAML